MPKRNATSQRAGTARERIRHALWAGLIALVFSVLLLLEPVDQTIWAAQSQFSSNQASGDIVYVGAGENLTDADFPHRREQLADFINALNAAGAEEIYVDMVFDRASTPEADAKLNKALRKSRGRAYTVSRYETGLDGVDRLERSVGTIRNGVPEVGSDLYRNFMGYIWEMPYTVSGDGVSLDSMAVKLAGRQPSAEGKFPISYLFELPSIPTYRFLSTLKDYDTISQLSGKKIIIGLSVREDQKSANIPGYQRLPLSLIHIYAAETLKSGHHAITAPYTTLLAALALLCLATIIAPKRMRHLAYATIILSIPLTIVVTPLLGFRISIASAIAFLVIYAGFRFRSRWKESFKLVDDATNLPTFLALEKDKDVAEMVPAIIVAKIHRFEEVRRTLPKEMQAEYVLRIIARLSAATQGTTIYLGPGQEIGWTMREKEPALLQEHLEGLRALFSSPLLVGDNPVDVGITFGVDITPSPNVPRRLAAAIAAAENTTETYDPIVIADTTSDEDLIWNISLQARIDSALASGEIYLAFQPKIMVQTGKLIGAEALVRWRDPIRGHIPPDHFVRQCETAGRMSQLTRFVLREACRAGNAFERHGLTLPLAVNISATLLHERNIVTMVREVLEETGFEPRHLTLEITETFRISNLERAAEILAELQSLGPKISMDDFGVGAASLEALVRLPFSELKIDRLFTSRMVQDYKAAGIVRNVLQLGKDLRIVVVAEGVEDESTLTLLRDSGCVVAQGYHISRPVSFAEILQFQPLQPANQLRDMV